MLAGTPRLSHLYENAVAHCRAVLLCGASGILSAQAAFQGFASETVVMLACVMVLSRRLTESGLLARLSTRLRRGDNPRPRSTGAWLMAVSAGLSSVVTNTSTTAVLIPVVLEIARRIKVHPGRFLMPVAFASMMGGSATLIGTSTNLAASGVLSRLGLPPFGVFEFALVGLTVSVAGIIMLTILGPWLLPANLPAVDDGSGDTRHFMATFKVPEGSPSIGRTLGELGLDTLAVTALAISREGGRVAAHPRRKLLETDKIILQGQGDALIKIIIAPMHGHFSFATGTFTWVIRGSLAHFAHSEQSQPRLRALGAVSKLRSSLNSNRINLRRLQNKWARGRRCWLAGAGVGSNTYTKYLHTSCGVKH